MKKAMLLKTETAMKVPAAAYICLPQRDQRAAPGFQIAPQAPRVQFIVNPG
jgi:hypothetical protein